MDKTETQTEELKPCPFCLGAVQFRKALWPSDGNTDAIIHAAPTPECGLIDFSIGTTDESVIQAWNRRARITAALEGGKDGGWIRLRGYKGDPSRIEWLHPNTEVVGVQSNNENGLLIAHVFSLPPLPTGDRHD